MNKFLWFIFICTLSVFLFKEDAIYLVKQITFEKNLIIEDLQKENSELHQKFLSFPTQTGKVITQIHGDYFLIVKTDKPVGTVVLGHNSVIGKIVKNTTYTQKIMLITNARSKVPVFTPEIGRAILKGDAHNKLRLTFIEYISPNITYKKGDIIYTLGIEGIFPKQHPIAIVESIENDQTIVCRPFEDINTLTHIFLLIK